MGFTCSINCAYVELCLTFHQDGRHQSRKGFALDFTVFHSALAAAAAAAPPAPLFEGRPPHMVLTTSVWGLKTLCQDCSFAGRFPKDKHSLAFCHITISVVA